jgi:hypothetical protein
MDFTYEGQRTLRRGQDVDRVGEVAAPVRSPHAQRGLTR